MNITNFNKEKLVSDRAESGRSSTSLTSSRSIHSVRPESTRSVRSRVSDSSYLSLGPQLIHSWESIKEIIAKSLGTKIIASLTPLNGDPSAIFTAEDAKQNHHTPIALSHGFQPIRNMVNPKPGIRQVCYLPNSSTFVSLGRDSIQTWKNGSRIKKIPILSTLIMSGKESSNIVQSFLGVTKWTYIDSYRIYLVANQQLELKVLNASFETLSIASAPKPILFIDFCERSKMVLCGGIGGISIYNIKKIASSHANIYLLEERLRIEKDLEEDWISFLYYENRKKCLYAACGLSVYVFDYVTGHKIDTYDQIHELSISCISFYEPSEYLITGAKDGSIKVWNVRKSLLFDFHDHYNAITGFMIVENICHDNWGTLPLIVSASLDSTIRMWNIETGQLLYRVETTEPCLGLNAIRKNLFYHFTETTIQLWNFNRFYHTFAVLLSKAFLLKKYKVSGKPARLLTASTNGSIQLLSILSGTNLGTGFPTNKELTLSQVEYDFDNEIIYALNTNGTITVYDSTVNPFQITQLWNNARNVNKETIECICGADFYHYEHGTSKNLDERLYKRGELLADYVLFGGTDGGQIHQIIFEKDREKNEPIIQAHSNKITMLFFDIKRIRLISGSHDRLIKIWDISIDLKRSNGFSNSSERKLDIKLKCVTVINLESFDNHPSYSYSFCPQSEQLGMHSQGELILATYDKTQTLRAQGLSHDSAKIISIVTTSNAKLWAANYNDSSLKVWDSKGVIIRDIQFNENVTCVSFANERGDLLVGLSNEINLIRMQDYMPFHFLKQLYMMDFPDDQDEAPLVFDKEIDIWEFQNQEKKLPVVNTLLEDSKHNNIDFEHLLELSKTRREEASMRKNKRQFISMEKNIYLKEMEMRAERIRAKADLLLHKDQPLLELIIPDLEDVDEAELAAKKRSRTYIEPPIMPKQIESGKTKLYMGRFLKKKVEKESKKIASAKIGEPTLSEFRNENRNSQPIKKRSKKLDYSLVDIIERSESESSNMDSLDSVDSVDSAIIEVEEPNSDDPHLNIQFIHQNSFLLEDAGKKEEHHKDLIHVSANELKLKVESHDEQRIKYMKEKARKLTEDFKNNYKSGMSLPNSIGMANVLPARRGSKSIVKNEQLFQKAKIDYMYIDREETASAPPPITQVKKRPKVNKTHQRTKSEPAPSPKITVAPKIIKPALIEKVEEEREEVKEIITLKEPELIILKPEPPPIEEPFIAEPIIIPVPKKEPISPEVQSYPDLEMLEVIAPEPIVPIPPMIPIEIAEIPEIATHRSIYQNYFEEEDVVEEKVTTTPIKSENATNNLIKLHGLNESDTIRLKLPSKKNSKNDGKNIKKKKTILDEPSVKSESIGKILKDADTKVETKKKKNSEEVIFDLSKYVKYEPVSEPLLKTRPKTQQSALDRRKPPLNSRLETTLTFDKPGPILQEKQINIKPSSPQKPKPPSNKKITNFSLKTSFPKGQQFARRNSFEEKEVVKPILDLLSNVNAPLDKNITVNSISAIVHDQLREGDSKKIVNALDALISLHSMFGDDVNEEKQFDTFVAPLLDSFSSKDGFVRKKVLTCLIDMGIRHDSVLTLLICALNERDKSVVELAIKGLANYGIADKEGLRRGMTELGMLKGVIKYSNTENLDKLALKLKKEVENQIRFKNNVVAEWVHQTPATPPGITRSDSYMDTLAGPFFPPDAHDFNAKQRALVMTAEANQGYDQYWKKKFMDQIVQKSKDEPFSWNSTLDLGTIGKKEKQPQLPIANLNESVSSSRTSTPQKPKIRGSPAQVALIMSRALGHGGLPPNVIFPKIKIVERPQTVNVPTVILKRQTRRPFTSVEVPNLGNRTHLFHL